MALVKKSWIGLFLLTMFSFAEGQAWDECCCAPSYAPSYDQGYLCSEWSVYADWIYWRTRRCELDFAVPFNGANSFVNGDLAAVEPNYQSGFRVGFLRQCDCLFFDVFYTHYHPDASNSTSSATGSLASTHFVDEIGGVIQGDIAFAQGKWWLDYDVVDLLVGYELSNNCCLQTFVFGGLKFAFIDQKLQSFYESHIQVVDEVLRVTQRVDMNAYGVNVGIGATYQWWRCFNFFGNLSYDVLLGDFERRFVYDFSGNAGATFTRAIDLRDDCWEMVGVYNLSFGLGYNRILNCGCFRTLNLSIGYEFHQWINMLDFLDYLAENSVIHIDRHLQSLGFDGLFIQLMLSF